MEPLRGYDLVVLEDRNYEVIPEGRKREKKPWNPLAKKKPLEVFAINNDDKHFVTYKNPVIHSDGIHSFSVTITLNFKVSQIQEDQINLIRKLDRDPLQLVKNEAARIIHGYLRNTDWEKLANDAQRQMVRRKALEDLIAVGRGEARTIFDAIQDHAQQYGLAINEIAFDIDIPQVHIKDRVVEDEMQMEERKKIAEIDRNARIEGHGQYARIQSKLNEHELKDIDKQQEMKERDIEKMQQLKEAAIDAGGLYINKVAQNISESSRSMDDLLRDLNKVMAIKDQLAGGTATQVTLGAGSGAVGGYLSSGAEDNFVSHFYEVMVIIKKANLEKSMQRSLLSALFHFIGSLLGNEPVGQKEIYVTQLEQLQLPKDLRNYFTAKMESLNNIIKNDNLL
ncbi:MAG: hypothetical protein ACK4TA_08700 [Saprospiraceae bacterium]